MEENLSPASLSSFAKPAVAFLVYDYLSPFFTGLTPEEWTVEIAQHITGLTSLGASE